MKRWLLLAGLALCSTAPAARAAPLWVAVGENGWSASSSDGIHWHPGEGMSSKVRLAAVVFGGGQFLAAGGEEGAGVLFASPDGHTWHALSRTAKPLEAAAFGRGSFVALRGLELFTAGAPGGVDLPLPEKLGLRGWALAAGDTEAGFRFVALAGDSIGGWRAVSSDGAAWDRPPMRAPEARVLAYGAGHFVAAGPSGQVASSHDGETWVEHPVAPEENLERIVWDGARFVARGQGNWVSEDGLAWRRAGPEIPSGWDWLGAGWALRAPPHGGLEFWATGGAWRKGEGPPAGPVLGVARRD